MKPISEQISGWHIICALHNEAAPLIKHYRLKKYTEATAFPVYLSQDQRHSLTVSGVSANNAAAAAGFTHALLGTGKYDIWLNIGVAGHRTLTIGDIIVAHKISEQGSWREWYPGLIYTPPCTTVEVLSCRHIINGYPAHCAVDMEASGFYSTACRFAVCELIQVIKIISDNQQNPAKTITKSLIAELVGNQISVIDQIIKILQKSLQDFNAPDTVPPHYEQLIKKWHFTQTQRQQLKQQLQRWQVLCPNKNPLKEFEHAGISKRLLQQINEYLDKCPISF